LCADGHETYIGHVFAAFSQRWFSRKARAAAFFLLAVFLTQEQRAQEPVVPSKNIDALFRCPDPRLQANKMVVYGIYRDLL